MNLEDLPIYILEEIFLKLSDRKVLRLVSKTFKEIVDESPRLIEKYALNVAKCYENGEVTPFYQYLKFSGLNLDGYKFINNYQYKDRIKGIHIHFHRHDTHKCSVMIQHILLNFNNMKYFKISEDNYDDNENPNINENYDCKDKLVENNHSKFISLEILSQDPLYVNHLVELFADIKSIKKLKIKGCCEDLPFVNWELDELIIECPEFHEDVAEEILCKQKPCLKILKISNLHNFLNAVVQHLPNLEKLHLDFSHHKKLENEFLLSNDKLKVLKLTDCSTDIECVETILIHYRNIEMLKIQESFVNDDNDFSRKITLHNLKKFILKTGRDEEVDEEDKLDKRFEETVMEELNKYLLNIEMPNLKYLEILKIPNNHLDEIKIFKHVEHLEVFCIDNFEKFLEFLQKFPALKLLKMTELRFNFNILVMETILENAPTLKQLQICEESIEEKNVSLEELKNRLYDKSMNLTLF